MPLLVEIVPARRGHRTVLWRLLQLYLHDFSEVDRLTQVKGRPA